MSLRNLGAIFALAFACWASAAAPQAQRADVLLLPFAAVNQADAWIGQAVQQNLLNELGRTAGISPLTPAAPPAQPIMDVASAVRAAADTGATHVVFGTYQAVEGEMRLMGQVVEVASGRVIGSAKATGAMRDLFALEDDLAAQVRRVLVGLRPRPEAQKAFVPVVPEGVARMAGGVHPGARLAGPLLDQRPQPALDDWDLRPRIVGDVEVNTYNYHYSYYAPRYYLLSPPVYTCVPSRRFHSGVGVGFSGAYHGSRGHVQFHGGAGQQAR